MKNSTNTIIYGRYDGHEEKKRKINERNKQREGLRGMKGILSARALLHTDKNCAYVCVRSEEKKVCLCLDRGKKKTQRNRAKKQKNKEERYENAFREIKMIAVNAHEYKKKKKQQQQ